MEEGANSMTMIDFPFSDMVSETVSSFHAPAMTGNKQLHVQIRPMISIRGDEKALRQLVTVLMDNALKYCPEHGDIYVHLEHYGKNVQLTITNTASNISRNQLPHLFERFYRGDASHSSQTKGYGIGLSIARAVTAAHKGRIAAPSSDGHSLTITVTLPSGTARLLHITLGKRSPRGLWRTLYSDKKGIKNGKRRIYVSCIDTFVTEFLHFL